jgi:hypothetical protein
MAITPPFAAARGADAIAVAPTAVVVAVGLVESAVVAAAIAVAWPDGAGGERQRAARDDQREPPVGRPVSLAMNVGATGVFHFGSVFVSVSVHSMTPKGAP